MAHQHRNNKYVLGKLDRCISQVCHDLSTRKMPSTKGKSSSFTNRGPIPCSSSLCRYTTAIHKDSIRDFRLELDSLMPFKVPRKARKVGSKENRRLTQIEAMKKIYQEGKKLTCVSSISSRQVEVNKRQESADDGGIIEWLDTLKIV